jgi:hypothetical protein
MTCRGTVRSGVVVLHDEVTLPEGTEVVVVLPDFEPAQPGEPSIWDKLSDLGRWAEDLPTDLPPDLAANHDYYLHGLPKRIGS